MGSKRRLRSHPKNGVERGFCGGPEGTLLIVPLLIAIAIGMWLWQGRRKPAKCPDE